MSLIGDEITKNIFGGGEATVASANPYTAIATAAQEKKKNFQNSLSDLAKTTSAIAASANNFTPNFQPVTNGFIAPQQMQTQQSTMPSLYKYLVS
jgi:hypothetical protein